MTVTGKRELAVAAVGAEQAQEEQQRLLDRDLAAGSSIRYSRSPARSKTTPRSAPTAVDEPLRLADRLAQRARASAPSEAKPCAVTASTPSGPSRSGSTNEAAE